MSGPGSRRAVLASALAPLAVLGVLVAGVSAAVVYPGEDAASGPGGTSTGGSPTTPSGSPSDSPTAPEGMQLVSGDGRSDAVFAVPETDDWTLTEAGTNLGYSTSDGSVTEGVRDPALFGADFCDDDLGLTNRAFVGFTRPVPVEDADVQSTAQELVTSWAGVLGADDEAAAPTVTPVRLDDGSAGWTGATVVPVTDPESDCDPAAREVRVVSVASSSFVATLVLVRDVRADGSDLDDGLSADGADEVLRTLDPQ
ncbi:hypothetical protein [uncultured Nocardioides sp.]|uniref:hypothetical protein n=1 Tax=uncultured Nocardioides sp. TaxID=198441 RepID=UPI0026322719|nr:hypothetical protein [uncultured Nocardioides sp.]